MMTLTIEPYEIVILVNYAWLRLFARSSSNQTVIADQGWNPLNWALLLEKTLRSIMTEAEKEDESLSGIFNPNSLSNNFSSTASAPPTYQS